MSVLFITPLNLLATSLIIRQPPGPNPQQDQDPLQRQRDLLNQILNEPLPRAQPPQVQTPSSTTTTGGSTTTTPTSAPAPQDIEQTAAQNRTWFGIQSRVESGRTVFFHPTYGRCIQQLDGSYFFPEPTNREGERVRPFTVQSRQVINNSRPLHGTISINHFNLRPQNNWLFTDSEGSVHFLQPDGTFWDLGVRTNGTRVRNSRIINGTQIVEGRPQPLSWTLGMAQLGLYPVQNRDGSFSRPGDNRKYFLQTDGTIFREGYRNSDNVEVLGATYVNNNGTLQWNTTRTQPLSNTLTLARSRAVPQANGNWILPSDDSNNEPYIVLVTNNNRIVRFRSGTNDTRVFEFNTTNNTWTQLPNRVNAFHTDAQVMRSLQDHIYASQIIRPTAHTANMLEFDRCITALQNNLTTNGCTNVQVSRRYNTSNGIMQLVSFTQGRVTRYKLLAVRMSGETVSNFTEFDFAQRDLQQVVQTYNLTEPNWNEINNVAEFIGTRFRINRDNSANAFVQSHHYGFAQIGDINNLKYRETTNYRENPLQVATTRLGQIRFNQERGITRWEPNSFLFEHNDSEFFRTFSRGTTNLGTNITNQQELAIANFIMQRYSSNTTDRRVCACYNNGNMNYVIAIGSSDTHVIGWNTFVQGGASRLFTRTVLPDRNITHSFNNITCGTGSGHNIRVPYLTPTNYNNYNNQERQSQLLYFLEHLRFTLIRDISLPEYCRLIRWQVGHCNSAEDLFRPDRIRNIPIISTRSCSTPGSFRSYTLPSLR